MYTPKQEDSPGVSNPAFYIEHATSSESEYSRESYNSGLPIVSSRGKRELSRMETINNYLNSQKGRELCMGTSLMAAVTLIVVGVTLLFTLHLSDAIVETTDISTFMLLLFVASSLSMLIMVVLGHLGKLTNDEHYKDQKRTAFLRGGMTVLATGGIVYYSLELAVVVITGKASCPLGLDIAKNSVAIIFTILQVAFLLRFSKVRINQCFAIVTLGRFMLMVIVATNAVVWLSALMTETMEELAHSDNSNNSDNPANVSSAGTDANTAALHDWLTSFKISTMVMKPEGDCHASLNHEVTQFLFPFLIEFCVVASTMAIAIWEKCGVGLEHMIRGDTESGVNSSGTLEMTRQMSSSASLTDESLSISVDGEDPVQKSGFFNSNLGLVCGWLSLVVAIFSVLMVFLGFYDKKERLVAYAVNFFFVVCGICAIPLTMHKMSRMRFKDEQIKRQRKGDRSFVKKSRLHRKMDRNLLTVTFLALLTYKMMSIPVAMNSNNVSILADAIASIVHGFMQTSFLNWYACQKRAKSRQERTEKPGRQFLEFLRMLNLSLWLVNTFLLKQAQAKDLHHDIFGEGTWVIISNILQPLTILYYFHSMTCIAEVIVSSYTHKYVGIPRANKQTNFYISENQRRSVVSFTDSPPEHTYNRSTSLPLRL